MKLLFDENLSYKLARLLADLFPDSIHVRDVGLKAAEDSEIWKYAQDNSFIICSKDSDLHQRSFLLGFPPKVIWVD
jgi:predicted nuclease of predicted toxin-antitoxin system